MIKHEVQESARRIATLIWLVTGLSGCWGDKASSIEVSSIVPPTPGEVAWQADGETFVASLAEHRIPLNYLTEIHAGIETRDGREALLQIAQADTVAARSLNEAGGVFRQSSIRRYHQALVQSYLKLKLEKELTPETVPSHYIDATYKRMRPYFDHFDSYYIMDFMLLCCRESVSYCSANAERLAPCFDSLKPKSEAVYAEISEAAPTSPDEFEALFSTVQMTAGDTLKFQTYSMYYDKSRTWDEMTDMNRLTKPVTHQIIKMKVGEISVPIRDSFGWHVLYLKRFQAEEHRKADDPSVRLEIGEKILSTVRQTEYTQLIQRAGFRRKVKVHLDRLNEIIGTLNQLN